MFDEGRRRELFRADRRRRRGARARAGGRDARARHALPGRSPRRSPGAESLRPGRASILAAHGRARRPRLPEPDARRGRRVRGGRRSPARGERRARQQAASTLSCQARRRQTRMKIVMTMLVRDEEDILDAQLAFHLNAGVDFVIATDHRSEDGTTEILERYARERPRPRAPRGRCGLSPGRVGDTDGSPRRDGLRCRLGDQRRRRRVLVATRGPAEGDPRRPFRVATASFAASSGTSRRDRGRTGTSPSG